MSPGQPTPARSTPAHSALVILVPEADRLVQPWRGRFDPSAREGLAAHVTLLYPFRAPDAIDEDVTDVLARCFAEFAPIDFQLTAIRQFPNNLLYLAPEPDAPFRHLTQAIWERFPATPPYGGKWPDIVPHLSVASVEDPVQFSQIVADFSKAADGQRPIAARTDAVTLIDNVTGRWQVRHRFRLGR